MLKPLKIALARSATAGLLVPWSASVHAHGGHGLTGSHWHTSDVWGFVAIAGMVAGAVWASRKDK